MGGVIDDKSTPSAPLTRRERRIARSRSQRTAALIGWSGYGVGVFLVITVAAWLAVSGGVAELPQRSPKETVVARVIAVPPSTSTTLGANEAPEAPVTDQVLATPTSTTSTTVPVLSVAATPEPAPPTP